MDMNELKGTAHRDEGRGLSRSLSLSNGRTRPHDLNCRSPSGILLTLHVRRRATPLDRLGSEEPWPFLIGAIRAQFERSFFYAI
jgi:hypothetical protein